MIEYCKDEKGQLHCPTYDQCHHRGICLATPKKKPLDPDEIIRICAIDLEPPEEMVDLGTMKIPRSTFDALKKLAEEQAKAQKDYIPRYISGDWSFEK